MANPLAVLTSIARRNPPPHRCPICHGAVQPGRDALRMRGEYYIHRRCATYRVRREAAGREFTRA